MRVLRFALGSTVGTLSIVAGYLWWTLLSPFAYERPADLPPIQTGEHQVFVYGTLTHAPVRWLVYGRIGDPEPASLPGFRQQALDLESAPDQSVQGMVLEVDAEELAALDRYERLGYRYKRVRLRLGDGRQVWVYRRL
ncbi:gamma-glutamylcyclotransferase family protein [Halomonas sp. YLGW01]|uniref:gamma-glutamylcyclotransferase family protein n=1 Tax=Halomonas sp. YLGW01 TaxID=2773308 RepID=UPI0017823B40|nr:gamma-glutamylcyclotransferase family protein [Halomonas sp. YLGW01]